MEQLSFLRRRRRAGDQSELSEYRSGLFDKQQYNNK
jgi:hypothetical protein